MSRPRGSISAMSPKRTMNGRPRSIARFQPAISNPKAPIETRSYGSSAGGT
jgi:hypothetical protein